MENACKEVRSRQTFPWQAVAFYGGTGKTVYIKSSLFFHLFKKKIAGLQCLCKGEGRKQQYLKCFMEKNFLCKWSLSFYFHWINEKHYLDVCTVQWVFPKIILETMQIFREHHHVFQHKMETLQDLPVFFPLRERTDLLMSRSSSITICKMYKEI